MKNEERPKGDYKNWIMIVEDHPMNQQIISLSLKKLGFKNIIVASHGQEAIDKLSSQPFEIILMDCQMPVMDGFDATKKIREQEKNSSNGKRIPIVALTADIIKSNREKCLSCGMDEHMNKPINILALRDIMNRFINEYRS